MFLFRGLHHAATRPMRICTNCLRNASTQSTSTSRGRSGKKQVIFSGIQPTGVPHLGNYFGALRQWVKLQNDAPPDTTLLFSVVDLHAITIKQDPTELARWRKEMLASLLAVGLDPKRCIIFAQSSVKQHAELMWILSCGASMGYLGRMTQWKVRAYCKHSMLRRPNAKYSYRASSLFQTMHHHSSPHPTKMLSSSVSSRTPSFKPPMSCSTTQPTSLSARTKRSILNLHASSPSASTTYTRRKTHQKPYWQYRKPYSVLPSES
jgi:hypothetical protein